VSDATFLEEWFEDEFDEELPLETSLYLKRQHDTEALTFLATVQPNDLVTSADLAQEQFEVERLPEFGYRRIGDAFGGDRFTFYSDNTFGRYKFNPSDADLGEQGYRFSRGVRPGIPSLGLVGVTGLDGPPVVDEDWTFRGDFRQEVDYPVAVGQFRVLPYVMGRYTGYSDSPDGHNVNRGLVGTGVRVNTQFWQVNNNAKSELFDINRTGTLSSPRSTPSPAPPTSTRRGVDLRRARRRRPRPLRRPTRDPPALADQARRAGAPAQRRFPEAQRRGELSSPISPATRSSIRSHSAGCSTHPCQRPRSRATASTPMSSGESATPPSCSATRSTT
jgi:hypothetical protein